MIETESDFIKDNPPRNFCEVRDVYLKINQLIADFGRYFYGTPAKIGFIDVMPEVKKEVQHILKEA